MMSGSDDVRERKRSSSYLLTSVELLTITVLNFLFMNKCILNKGSSCFIVDELYRCLTIFLFYHGCQFGRLRK